MERLRAYSRRTARSVLVGMFFLHLLGLAGNRLPRATRRTSRRRNRIG